jgi:hypothetical protein
MNSSGLKALFCPAVSDMIMVADIDAGEREPLAD